jgi:hypothetical protein
MKKPVDLPKCIKEERENRISCVIVGFFTLAASAFFFFKAGGAAVDYIDLNAHEATNAVFKLAFAGLASVGLFSLAVAFLVRAIMAGPNQKAIRLLAERVAELEAKMQEVSGVRPGG